MAPRGRLEVQRAAERLLGVVPVPRPPGGPPRMGGSELGTNSDTRLGQGSDEPVDHLASFRANTADRLHLEAGRDGRVLVHVHLASTRHRRWHRRLLDDGRGCGTDRTTAPQVTTTGRPRSAEHLVLERCISHVDHRPTIPGRRLRCGTGGSPGRAGRCHALRGSVVRHGSSSTGRSGRRRGIDRDRVTAWMASAVSQAKRLHLRADRGGRSNLTYG